MWKAFKWFLFVLTHPLQMCYWHGPKDYTLSWGGGGFYCRHCDEEAKELERIRDEKLKRRGMRLFQ